MPQDLLYISLVSSALKYGCHTLSTSWYSTSWYRRVYSMDHLGFFAFNHISIGCIGKAMALKIKHGIRFPYLCCLKHVKESSSFKSVWLSAKHCALPRCPECEIYLGWGQRLGEGGDIGSPQRRYVKGGIILYLDCSEGIISIKLWSLYNETQVPF